MSTRKNEGEVEDIRVRVRVEEIPIFIDYDF